MNKTLTQSQALELFDQMTELRNLKKETRTNYHSWVVRFLNHTNCQNAFDLDPFVARDYLIWLNQNSSYAPSTIKVVQNI